MMMRYRMNRERGVRFRTVSLFQKNSTLQREFLGRHTTFRTFKSAVCNPSAIIGGLAAIPFVWI